MKKSENEKSENKTKSENGKSETNYSLVHSSPQQSFIKLSSLKIAFNDKRPPKLIDNRNTILKNVCEIKTCVLSVVLAYEQQTRTVLFSVYMTREANRLLFTRRLQLSRNMKHCLSIQLFIVLLQELLFQLFD